MKSNRKAIISVVLVIAMLLPLSLPAFASESGQTKPLQFRQDGTFTILQITDSQDTQWPSPNMLTLIQKALDVSKPDLVVFTGDQFKSYDSDFSGSGIKWKVEQALYFIINPVVKRGIPFAVAFGNHDRELGVSLEDQVKILQKYKGCLVVDEGPSISGCGNYNLPILSSDGTHTAFNLYLLDSNQDKVLPDQIAWYISKSNELKAANGGIPVPSIEFQHIVAYNDDLVNAFAAQGDVMASFYGHGHYYSNTYTRDGIDFVATPAATFNDFGPGMDRGVRVIKLNENNTSTYQSNVLTFVGLLGENPITDLRYKLFTLGELDGDPLTVTLSVLSGIGNALSYLVSASHGNIGVMFTALLEFFGVDVGLIS